MTSNVAPALAGLATGLRTSTAMSAVLTAAPSTTLPGLLRRRAVRRASWALVVGELVADKLPGTPSRTEPGGLSARVVFGGGSGALLARSAGGKVAAAAGIGATAALASAFVGHAARGFLSQRMPPVVAALLEDAVAITLALSAVRMAQPSTSS